MAPLRAFGLSAATIALATIVAGCSSGQDKTSQGSFAIKLAASRPAATAPGPHARPDDPISRLRAANITLSGIEARRSDGTWVTADGTFPKTVDLLALANDRGSATLPADLLPEGQYTALQFMDSGVELTLADGTLAPIEPPGPGWAVMIPVDFSVATGQWTILALGVRLDRSLRLINDSFEFEPEFEVKGVEHN